MHSCSTSQTLFEAKESRLGVLTNLTSYANMCKGGVLRTFLPLDSSLSEIPKDIKGRKTKGAVYQRCVEIQSSAIREEVLETIVEST